MAVCSMPALQGIRAVLRPNFRRRRKAGNTNKLAETACSARENVRLRLRKESKPASDRPKHITQGRNA